MKDSTALRTIAFIIIIWSLLMLAVSLPHINMGPEEKPPPLPGPQATNTTAGGGNGDVLRALYIVFIGSLVVMSALYIIISILNKDKEAFKEILGGLLVMVVVSGFFMGALYISDHPNILGVHMKDANSGSGNGTGNSTVSQGYVGAGPMQYMVVLFALAIVIIVIASVIMSLRSKKIEKVESQSVELREKMMLAIKDLKKGKEVQEVIIKCYDEMCRILSKSSGMKEGDSMTPREFESAILERMDIDREPVLKLTALFEEAKYSTHPIDDSKRKSAIIALENLKNEVERWEREKE